MTEATADRQSAPDTLLIDTPLIEALQAALTADDSSNFEASVRQAIDPLPAQLLFHMRIELEPAIDVAALVTTDGETDEFLIVRRTDGEPATVETASESDLPIAALIPAYAGLAQTLPVAA